MDILKLFGSGLVWVSGTVAGFTALLYAFGFIATTIHQRLLGIAWGAVSRDTLWYLGVGSQVVARWATIAIVALVIVVLVGEALGAAFAWAKRRDGRFTGWVGKFACFIDQYVVWIITLLLLWPVKRQFDQLGDAGQLKGILFADPNEMCTRGDGLWREILDADSGALAGSINGIAAMSAISLGVGVYALRRLIVGEGPALPLLICISVAVVSVSIIPVAHGIFAISAQWPSLSGSGGDLGSFGPDDLWLLGKVTDGVWAWEPEKRAAHWFPIGEVTHLNIGPSRSAWFLQCRGA